MTGDERDLRGRHEGTEQLSCAVKITILTKKDKHTIENRWEVVEYEHSRQNGMLR